MNEHKAIVFGAGGFIGSHLVKRLKTEGYYVTGADLKYPEFSKTWADAFYIGDLRNISFCELCFENEYYDEAYQLAADMGGAGFVFTGENDADIMHNSALINLNLASLFTGKVGKVFYSSSACIYPAENQVNPDSPLCSEDTAYPANPDSNYGWEKLFSERLYQSFAKCRGLDIRIARFHNIFGPEGTWHGGREKAPAAICRKIALAENGDEIEIWGDGNQTRSFLFIDECLEGIRRLMNSDFPGPVNIGSEEMISINALVNMVSEISGKSIKVKHIEGPQGVRGRNSDNKLIQEKLNWKPSGRLIDGMTQTYRWIYEQINKNTGRPYPIE
jgi:GDP-D-mannose 3',5'-epimerase